MLQSGWPGLNIVFCDLDGIILNSLNLTLLTCKLCHGLLCSWEALGSHVCDDQPIMALCQSEAPLRLEPRSLNPWSIACSINHTSSWEWREECTAHKLGVTQRSQYPPTNPKSLCYGSELVVRISFSMLLECLLHWLFIALPSVSGCWQEWKWSLSMIM